MRLTIAVLACLATALPASAQTKKPPKSITLSGCIQRDEKNPDQYTITDKKAGKTFRLTGASFAEYLGRPVTIDGGVVVKGVTIRGGLQPNPNVAAQAGAMDPARAAVAGATGSSAVGSSDDVQEFRAKTIRSTGGSCP